jgi:hypothetical protein
MLDTKFENAFRMHSLSIDEIIFRRGNSAENYAKLFLYFVLTFCI